MQHITSFLLRWGLILALLSGCMPIQPPSETTIPSAATMPPAVAGVEQPTLDGAWHGSLSVAGQELEIIVHVASQNGTVTATIDIPQQGAAALPLHDIVVELPSVHFEMLTGPALAAFDGELAEDGSLSGAFTQAGVEGTFTLTRRTESVAASAPAAETIYRDPAGRFTAPIPTNWRMEEGGSFVILTSPEEGLKVYLMAFESDDLVEAIAQAWLRVDPDFAYKVDEVIDEPAQRVDRAVTVTYEMGDDEETIIIGGGWLYRGIAYVELFRGDLVTLQRRSSQISIINSGFDILALEDVDLSDKQPLPITDELLTQLEAYINESLIKYGVPGAAVAIVYDSKVVYTKGFGVRDPDTGEPMTPETQMMIGSTSKTMTTLLMATLVDDGLMQWDTPVIEIMPNFAVQDPELTKQITVRNLVCACTGVPRRDFELIFNADDLSAEEIVESLGSFEFFTDFGEAFQYSNQMVAAGGYVAAMAAGGEYGQLYAAYEEAMRQRLLQPLGMESTTLSFDKVTAGGNYATPHGLDLRMEQKPIPLSMEKFVVPIAPAGAYWSNVLDMANYLIMELNEGVAADGQRIVSSENLQVTWTPQISITQEAGYGLGWIVGNYKGQPMIEHGGNTLGYTSDLAFLPNAKLGISVLTNGRVTNFFNEGVRYRLLELLFEQEFHADESIAFGYERIQKAYDELRKQITDTLDVEMITPYLGRFSNEALGELTVTLAADEKSLLVDAGEFQSLLLPRVEEDGEFKDLIFFDVPMAGATLKLEKDEDSKPVLVLGQGVVEYRFVKQE